MAPMSQWHKDMQEMFPMQNREVRFSFTHHSLTDEVTERARRADVCVGDTVIEYQHSRITLNEVNARNDDYEKKAGKRVVWVIDCTQNINKPRLLSGDEDEDELWILEFEKKWHVESMKSCNILFADFGDRIFRVPVEDIRFGMVKVFGSIPKGPEFVSHIASPELTEDVATPFQSTLTVAQDPHGSGKTYSLTRMMIHTDLKEYRRYDRYRAFIVVTKAHPAKEVVYAEFMKHLDNSGFEVRQNEIVGIKKKYVVKFTRPDGSDILCIFGTADSYMGSLADNKECGTDPFINLVQTIHRHGPTKLQGPKGRIRYANEQPQINAKTLLITDEATMLREVYAGAFATLMYMCHVDVHLAGDVQQSTFYEDNLLTKVMREYNEAPDSPHLPSFPGSEVIIRVGKEVRRFGQKLVDFRNTVMRNFHDNPTHNLNIPLPVAAVDVVHERCEYSIHGIDPLRGYEADPETIQDAADEIMARLEEDVDQYNLLPNDFLIVTPFVRNNLLMDQMRTRIEELWAQKFTDPAYVARVRHLSDFEQTLRLVNGGQEVPQDREKPEDLPWLCVLHRSEDGKPIDTTESKYGTRIVSIHAAQGDGRRFEYLVGMTQWALSRFSGGKINLKYESLMNVAVSRMKEVIRVFLDKTYDHVWECFIPLMPPDLKGAVPPGIKVTMSFKTNRCEIDTSLDGMQDLFEATKARFDVESVVEEQTPATLVDYAHHEVRMATAHSLFHAKVLQHQAKTVDVNKWEQLFTVFNKVAEFQVKSLGSKEYYKELYRDDRWCIPVLHYDTGAEVYSAVHQRIVKLLREVQADIKVWLEGNPIRIDTFQSPEKAVVMQYAVGYVTSGSSGNVKMDTVYDVVNCYMHITEEQGKLSIHYEALKNISRLFEQVVEKRGDGDWSWKIGRKITLGKANGGALPFDLKGVSHHLLITDTLAMPVILVPNVDEMSMAKHCATAILQTLLCLQPEMKTKDKKKGHTSTCEYVTGKQVTVCFVPIKASRPVFVDVTSVVEENISLIAEWVSQFIQHETEADHPQLVKLAEHDFEKAVEKVEEAQKKKKCLDYMSEAFKEAECNNGIEDLDRELRSKMNRDLRRFKSHLQKRD